MLVVGVLLGRELDQLPQQQRILAHALDGLDEETLQEQALAAGVAVADVDVAFEPRVLLRLLLHGRQGHLLVRTIDFVHFEVVSQLGEALSNLHLVAVLGAVVRGLLELLGHLLVAAQKHLHVGEDCVYHLVRHQLHSPQRNDKHADESLQVLDVLHLRFVHLLQHVLALLRLRHLAAWRRCRRGNDGGAGRALGLALLQSCRRGHAAR
mmetsp:Transcript_3750/g.13267  ORF Transcript_3750/g.13267 Transcript_3750/m.13267 type:complete len:209 (+) Transcript_3750:643-1269(+)